MVIHKQRPARLLLPSPLRSVARRRSPGRVRVRHREENANMDAVERVVFEALRAYRIKTARSANVPPYVIASDRTLRDIAVIKPRSIEQLMLVHGIGLSKADKYGDELLAVVRTAAPGVDD